MLRISYLFWSQPGNSFDLDKDFKGRNRLYFSVSFSEFSDMKNLNMKMLSSQVSENWYFLNSFSGRLCTQNREWFDERAISLVMAVIFYAQPRFQVFDCAIEMNSGKITVNLVAIHYCPADNQSCSVLIQRLYSHNNRICQLKLKANTKCSDHTLT